MRKWDSSKVWVRTVPILHIVAYNMLIGILWGSLVCYRVGSVTDAHSGTQERRRDL